MAIARALNKTKGTSLADELRVADGFLSRLKGLLFTSSLPAGQGLYITPCQAIHMVGMAYAIDCVFVDKQGLVVGLCRAVSPWGLSPLFGDAQGCIELPVGTIEKTLTEIGDLIELIR